MFDIQSYIFGWASGWVAIIVGTVIGMLLLRINHRRERGCTVLNLEGARRARMRL